LALHTNGTILSERSHDFSSWKKVSLLRQTPNALEVFPRGIFLRKKKKIELLGIRYDQILN